MKPKRENKVKGKVPNGIVLVLGSSGTGKSTFINQASGSKLAVSDGLRSCTSKVEESNAFQLDGRLVTLVDTPGFDDTNMPNPDILQMIADYLVKLHKDKKPLSGIIYMHRISDVRIGGASNRSLKMLNALCGDAALANLMIVTTMWDNTPADVAETRFRELQSHGNIAPMIAKGAQLRKHSNTPTSAHSLLRWFLSKKAPVLQIQRELATGKNGILSTTAGVELEREMAASEEKFRRQLVDLAKEMGEAGASTDSTLAEELARTKREVTASIEQLQRDRERLLKGRAKELATVRKDVRKAERDLSRVQARSSNLKGPKRPSAIVVLFRKLLCMSTGDIKGSGVAPRKTLAPTGTSASTNVLSDKSANPGPSGRGKESKGKKAPKKK
ncbi:hypothetical protein PHLGIDRAFT_120860 [Phlebiopsis gigantea 11061_1 CR5-6]|uniref:AIG1-type G domain-containing protein n=1 Tax=Phlebiopsis gigantea (strain 11061_1 CR5-6) TaxID=745531 RepID=A0A0C3NHL4_PHLG1|nr:hypothetical protein PHLGIDRAFT_120860 [Phlebiopsis gigantea 11061_1 CR5-6]